MHKDAFPGRLREASSRAALLYPTSISPSPNQSSVPSPPLFFLPSHLSILQLFVGCLLHEEH